MDCYNWVGITCMFLRKIQKATSLPFRKRDRYHHCHSARDWRCLHGYWKVRKHPESFRKFVHYYARVIRNPWSIEIDSVVKRRFRTILAYRCFEFTEWRGGCICCCRCSEFMKVTSCAVQAVPSDLRRGISMSWDFVWGLERSCIATGRQKMLIYG